ncbi:hypothetical protein [Streptomyces harbinensis]|uniref:hypothetical protein n=1 Tax=Streptomyces harbinensis TaxID=1176198 RepID=UPI003674B6E3
MAFPQDRLPVRLELAFGADPAGDPGTWSWTDVSSDLLDQQITIRRGRSDEASQVQPTTATLTLDNTSGAYTPGHPLSPHYPYIRQGVPARLWVQAGQRHLLVPDAPGSRAQTTTALKPPTELDVRVELALDCLPAQVGSDPPPDSGLTPWEQNWSEIAGQYWAGTNQRSWMLVVNATGGLSVRWSGDGDLRENASAVTPVPYVSGQRCAIRATLRPGDGNGWVLRSYHAPSLDGPWTLLEEATGASEQPLNQQPLPIQLGDIEPPSEFPSGAGRYYRFQLRDGIDGPIITDVDFTRAAPGDTEVTDDHGVTWQLQGGAEITNWRRRLVGQVDEWAPTWPYGDLSQGAYPGEARVSVTISGILRRLGAGALPLQSTLRRYIPTRPGLTAYWPMEDGAESTTAASALPGVPALKTTGLTFANASALPSSAPLPTVGQAGGTLQQRLPPLPDGSTGWRVEMVYHLDSLPETRTEMMSVDVAGGLTRIVGYLSQSETRLELWREDELVASPSWSDPSILTSAAGWCRARIVADPFEGQTRYRFSWAPIGIEGAWWVFRSQQPYSTPTQINCQWGAALSGMAVGHVTCTNRPLSDVYGGDIGGADDAWRGERALARMRRLAREEQLPLSAIGAYSGSPRMGPQRIATFLTLLQECADADGGILSERREVPGLQYRPRQAMFNQPVGHRLNARANEIDEPFAPVLDDQQLRNDITLTRVDGSSARATDPDSIRQHGLYDDAGALNIFDDAALPDIAAWRLHRGTWPGMRYPAVTTALDIAPNTAEAWMDRAEGDRVQVTDLPPQHPPGPVDLMVGGTTETITPTRWSIEATASPAGPWTVGEVAPEVPGEETGPIHVDTDGSELAAPASEDDTELSVVATVGEPWSTDPADVPWDITVGGERMTVTAVGEPGGGPWAGAGDRHEGQDSLAAVAPSVDGPGLLICAWSGFGQSGNTYATPAGMTAGPRVGGQYANTITAWESIGAGPSGTRTLTVVGEPDAWSAVSVRATGGTVAGHWAAHGNQAAATITTTSAAVGQWLVAVCGWDWDPGALMPPPTGGDWQPITESGGATSSTSRLRAWARPVTTAGTQVVSMASGTNIFDIHLRVWLLSGVPSSSAQPFSVVRSVNGISKPHAAGTDVRLADPMTIAL